MIISDPRRWPSTAAVAGARLVARTATVVRASSSPGERASYSRELKCRVDADECHNGWRWPPAVRRRPSSRWADLGALPGRETDALRANALSGGRAAWHTRAQVPRARQRAVSSAVQRGSQFLGSGTAWRPGATGVDAATDRVPQVEPTTKFRKPRTGTTCGTVGPWTSAMRAFRPSSRTSIARSTR